MRPPASPLPEARLNRHVRFVLLDRVVLLAGLGVLGLRLPFLAGPAAPDEAGYLLVARHWSLLDQPTGSLYGHFWVDRPPLLLLVFKLADVLPGSPMPALRLLGLLACLLGVGAAAVLGARIGGLAAARAAALVAAALTASDALGAQEIDGELLGVPIALLSLALLMSALASGAGGARPGGRRAVLLGAGAGAAATGALLVKQNIADGWVFALVLAGLAIARREVTPVGRRTAVGFAAGSGAVAAAVLSWAVRGPGVWTLWEATYGFRVAAARAVDSGSHARPDARLHTLLWMLLLSGLAVLLAVGGRAAMRGMRRGESLAWAAGAVLAVEVVGVLAGASFWLHYLLLLVPGSVLLTALLARHRRTTAAVVTLVAGSAVAFTGLAGVQWAAGHPHGADEQAAGRWLAGASLPGDTLVVAYGRADVVLASGLGAPYPLLWSLPVRVRDPQLARLGALLASPRRPTWLLEWSPLDTWGLDPRGRLQATVDRLYRPAGELCGHPVLLDRAAGRRPTPPGPRC